MNWEISGKHKNGGKGTLRMVGGPDTEDAAREAVKGSHPDFTVEALKPLDAAPKAVTTEPAKPRSAHHPKETA